MKKLHYLGLISVFIASLLLFSCELADLVNARKPSKKPNYCPPIEERVNLGNQLDCGLGYIPVEYTLWAGKYNDAGTVTISNDDDNLYITYTTNETADLGEVRVNVWYDAEDVPCKRPSRRKADFREKNINANEFIVEIPLKEDINCDAPPTFYVAAYAALVEDNVNPGGSENASEIAYGGDDPAVRGNSRGAWFYVDQYNVECCDDLPPIVATEVSNSAFAFGEQCFLDLGFESVGWTNGTIGVDVIDAGCNILIDDMSVGGVYIGDTRAKAGYIPIPVPPGSSGSTTILDATGSILGGQRDLTLNKISGNDYYPSIYSETNEYGDVIFYNSSGGENSIWTLTYGEGGDLNSDFTIGNSDRIRVNAFDELDYNGFGTPLTVTVWGNGDSASVSTVLLNNSGPFDFMFDDFLYSDSTPFDFTDVDGIKFEFEQIYGQNRGVDYGIGTICVYGAEQTLPTTTTTPIYIGAEQCDATTATMVGSLTILYDGSIATVTYTMEAGYRMNEAQLYVGNEILPRDVNSDLTVAPDEYPFRENTLDGVSTYTFNVTGLSGDIYVVAHALVYSD